MSVCRSTDSDPLIPGFLWWAPFTWFFPLGLLHFLPVSSSSAKGGNGVDVGDGGGVDIGDGDGVGDGVGVGDGSGVFPIRVKIFVKGVI